MSDQVVMEAVLGVLPDIEAAAEAYVKARDERMALTKREVECRTALLAAMNGAERSTYQTADGLFVTVTSVDKVKVRSTDTPTPDEADLGGEG